MVHLTLRILPLNGAEKELVNSEPDWWIYELNPVNDQEET